MLSDTHDVVVIGGGPVGMGLAIELGQRGIRTAVVERHPQPQPIPKGQNLTQRTMEHFHFWGCEAELRAARTFPEGVGIGGITTYRTLLSDYHYDWLNRARVRDYYFTANERLPQYATEGVLRARAAEIDAIEILYGWSGTGLTQDEGGVTVETAEHGGEGRRTLRASYAVGCDGSRSTVREAAGIGQDLSDHGRVAALVVFRSPELDALLSRYPGKAFFCVLHPEYQGYWLFFGRVDQDSRFFFHAPVPPGTTRESFDFASLLHRAVGQPFDLTIEHVGLWDIRVSLAERYRAGRVFIAGDAAHSHPPYGGYGINTGFEDARNLGWKLAATLQGWGGPALLDSYDAERRPVFASTARDFIERFIDEDRRFLQDHSPEKDGAAGFAREWAQRNEGATEVLAFEPNYQGSPLIGGSGRPAARGRHEFAARAGHHLAPRPLSDGRNVFEALGEGFTLIALDADPTALAAFETEARRLEVPLEVVRDNAEGARSDYGARMILVRPDQFVAWTGDRGDVRAILSRATGAHPPPS